MQSHLRNKLLYMIKNPFHVIIYLITRLPYFHFLTHTVDYQSRPDFFFWFKQKVLNFGGNRKAYWPVHWTSQVYDVQNILVGIDAYPGVMKGCYIQGKGGIEIGDYSQFGPNVVIVSANHDVYDSRKHVLQKVKIGKYCWIGAGAKIMPGVELGDFTIVGAGAVVTRSYNEGLCVLTGMPAQKIKELNSANCVRYEVKNKFRGYISDAVFEEYRKKHLKV